MSLKSEITAYLSSHEDNNAFEQFKRFPDLCENLIESLLLSLNELNFTKEQRTEFQRAFHGYRDLLEKIKALFESPSFARLVDDAKSGLKNTREQLMAEAISRQEALRQELEKEELLLQKQISENEKLLDYVNEFERRKSLTEEDLERISNSKRQLEKVKESLLEKIPPDDAERFDKLIETEHLIGGYLEELNGMCSEVNKALTGGITGQLEINKKMADEIIEKNALLKEIRSQHEKILNEHREATEDLKLYAEADRKIYQCLGAQEGRVPADTAQVMGEKIKTAEETLSLVDSLIRDVVEDLARRQEDLRRARRPGG